MLSSTLFTTEFWNQRAVKNGHTGYADPFLYAYDQQARLFAIQSILIHKKIKGELALDYGCGSGDFLQLLVQYFKNVIGYDISNEVLTYAKKNNNSASIELKNDLTQIQSRSFDLILSVTVLQGLTLEELDANLNYMSNALNKSGYLLCMEFFVEEDLRNDHLQKRTSCIVWEAEINKHHLKILETYYFYNPVENPCPSWLKYKSNLYLKILKPMGGFKIASKIFSTYAEGLISKYQDVIQSEKNKYKIYLIQKTNH